MFSQSSFIALLAFFEYKHLPENLQETSKLFYNLAWKLYSDAEEKDSLAMNYQLYYSLTQLLVAKDAAVRSVL